MIAVESGAGLSLLLNPEMTMDSSGKWATLHRPKASVNSRIAGLKPLSRWEKAWKRRICDEIVKPLKGIQRVKGPPWSCGVQCRGGVSLIRAFVLNLRTGSVMRREKAQARVPRGRKYRRDDQGRTAL